MDNIWWNQLPLPLKDSHPLFHAICIIHIIKKNILKKKERNLDIVFKSVQPPKWISGQSIIYDPKNKDREYFNFYFIVWKTGPYSFFDWVDFIYLRSPRQKRLIVIRFWGPNLSQFLKSTVQSKANFAPPQHSKANWLLLISTIH